MSTLRHCRPYPKNTTTIININIGLYKKSSNTNSQSNITKINNYKKANWEKYQIEINKHISLLETPKTDNKNTIDNLTEKFTEMIQNAADVSIPEIKIKKQNNQVPWWNQECSDAIKKPKPLLIDLKNTTQ